jgi:L-rhamnose mutarotase
MTARWGLTLGLRDGQAIERYRAEHQRVWPEVLDGLRGIGVREMQIFLHGRRLFMYMETDDLFDVQRAFARLEEAPRCREWGELMQSLQEPVPEAAPGEWWSPMELVFDLEARGAGAAGL